MISNSFCFVTKMGSQLDKINLIVSTLLLKIKHKNKFIYLFDGGSKLINF